MSALGEYIHSNIANYRAYGLNRSRIPGGVISPNAALNAIDERISGIADVEDKTLNEIRKRLKLMTSQGNYSNENKEQYIRAREAVYEMLAAASSVNALGRVMGSTTGTVKKGIINEQLKLSRSAVQNMWYTARGGKSMSYSYYELKQISKKAKAFRKELDEMISKINKKKAVSQKELGAFNMKLAEWNALTGNSLNGLKMDGNSLEEDIALIDNAVKIDNVYQNVAGQMGELLVGAIGDTSLGLANDALKREIRDSVVGDNATKVTLDKKLFYDYTVRNFKNWTDEGNSYSIGATKDKVDVRIKIDEVPVAATVKNYLDASKIELQKELNLFYPIALLNQYDNFGTHWLNMHALGVPSAAFDNVLEKEIRYEALAHGNAFKDVEDANVFIAIDRPTGKVAVASTKTLINTGDKFLISPNIGSIQFKNTWQGGRRKSQREAMNRVGTVINELHQVNLRVQLRTELR